MPSAVMSLMTSTKDNFLNSLLFVDGEFSPMTVKHGSCGVFSVGSVNSRGLAFLGNWD